MSRFFPVPPLPASSPEPNISSLDVAISHMATQCWAHYEDDDASPPSSQQANRRPRNRQHRQSLYLGSLGPCAYLRYRLAKSLSWSKKERERKRRLLNDSSMAVEHVKSCHPMHRNMRVTLLEGERVGALALYAAIHSSLESEEGMPSTQKVSNAKREILEIGNVLVQQLPDSECEVLYGRAGYLHAIKLVRTETGDLRFGRRLVERTVKDIIKEGERNAGAERTNTSGVGNRLPLLWAWHSKVYLGAIHGVVGILYTLLCFYEEVSIIDGAIDKIRVMTMKLNEMCFESSGNLKSSIGSERDELVHLCHGAPGYVLFLLKACEVLNDRLYLERAKDIARSVICQRGLLRKGMHCLSIAILLQIRLVNAASLASCSC